MSSSESDKKPASDFRQSPIIDFFTAEDTSTNDDPRGRKRTVPMKVMCLGLSRSGTESLAKALEMLGLKTYHDKSRLTSSRGTSYQC